MHHMNLNHPFKQSLLSCAIALAVTACGSGGGGDSGAAEQSKGSDNGNVDQLRHQADVVNSLGILFGEQFMLPGAVINKPEGAPSQAAAEALNAQAEQDGEPAPDSQTQQDDIEVINCPHGGTHTIIVFDHDAPTDSSDDSSDSSTVRQEYDYCKTTPVSAIDGVATATINITKNAQFELVSESLGEYEQLTEIFTGFHTRVLDGKKVDRQRVTPVIDVDISPLPTPFLRQEYTAWQNYSEKTDFVDSDKDDREFVYTNITLVADYDYTADYALLASGLAKLDGSGRFTEGENTVNFTIKTTVPFGFIGSNYQGEFDIMLNGSRVRMVCDNSPNATLFVDINNDGIVDYTFMNSLDGLGLRDI